MKFSTIKELLELCDEHNLKISEVMIEREKAEFEVSEEKIISQLKASYEIMKSATKKPIEEQVESMGGLLGGEAAKMNEFINSGKSFCGKLMDKAIMYALATSEVNASMGLIVAAPTAGASGVIPGCLVSLQEEYEFEEDVMVKALANASAIGYIIMRHANVSGAQGGCQAEVGSASAMAASAICECFGGTPEQCASAASHALMNVLGLVCDPIKGLVESPCQTRNALGTSNALISAQIALSGIQNIVPLDEMVVIMDKVGKSLPHSLRETALGGSASAPSVCGGCK